MLSLLDFNLIKFNLICDRNILRAREDELFQNKKSFFFKFTKQFTRIFRLNVKCYIVSVVHVKEIQSNFRDRIMKLIGFAIGNW